MLGRMTPSSKEMCSYTPLNQKIKNPIERYAPPLSNKNGLYNNDVEGAPTKPRKRPT